MSDVSKWFDRDGACKICEGEIPYGHDLNCFIYQKELEIKELEQQLSNSIPKEAVRELVGEWTEAAKQCEEAGMTSISEWEIVHDLNKLLEGELPPILQKQQGLDGEG